MLDLTFGEQVKLVLSRKGMTIKELAEIIEKRTGKKMSRQNLTQRLGRDNFQEQDMRMIAEILECPFRLSILSDSDTVEEAHRQSEEKSQAEQVKPAAKTTKENVRVAKAKARREKKAREAERLAEAIEQVPSEMRREPVEKEMTLGDYLDIHEELVRQETERLPKLSEEETEAVEATDAENGVSDAEGAELSGEIAEEEAAEVKEKTEEQGEPEEQIEAEGSEHVASEEKLSEAEEDRDISVQEESGQEGSPEPEESVDGETEPKVDVEELLREMEELERERQLLEQQVKEAKEAKEARAQEELAHEERKVTGWRAMFQRRTKKERQEELQEEAKIVEQVILREPEMEDLEDDYIEYGEPEPDAEEAALQEESRQQDPEDLIGELMEEDEDADAEDLTRGERNPYTGHEYETNSVRMHPKRIGYVQLYDRRDHGWTDMTEWAFLGYQERKKALLGKDYDPPIYLD